jgi:DNA topoisomerase-1
VIVESPAKARTIARFLGDDFQVESSVGHIRDLPAKAAEIPEAYKKEKWANLGVDVDNHFKPLYVVSPNKKDHVRHLKAALKDASELYLATDEDREGEAIAWHLLEVLNPKVPVRRMVFHEITPEAIQHAIEHPRELDRRLVDAQEARRIFDRLYGYEVSPVLWRKIQRGLSAGRVQSVAIRIVVERERERIAFVRAGYWDLDAALTLRAGDRANFHASLVEVNGARVATGRDFDATGRLSRGGAVVLDEATAVGLRDGLANQPFTVSSVEAKPYTRKPYAPFITSTLQVEAGRKLRFSSSQTMALAQSLYQNGFITYMRTDSTTLSDTALSAARSQIRERFGADYLPDAPRRYEKKVKNAQEAHEAIRPSGDTFRTPDEVKGQLNSQEFRLYELIWQRTIASQMTDARGETVSVRLSATTADGTPTTFAASGRTILFPGFLRAYVEGTDDDGGSDDAEKVLPAMAEGDLADADEIEAKGHETQPPARFTEASLVKRLEELGVGRPSTYAATISTILDRGYVRKKGSALVPNFTAFAVVTLLERHFADLVDYELTARMEDDLDRIARGAADQEPWLRDFYFGVAEGDRSRPGLKELTSDIEVIDARDVNSIPLGADSDGVPIVARVGKFGPYLQRGEDTASIPDDTLPDELTPERCLEILAAPSNERELGVHPETGLMIHAKAGRFGPYVQMGEHDDETGEKPKTSSLFSTMELSRITLEDALQLLSLPRVVGLDPADGEEITAQNGRYGPYVSKGKESRTIENEELLLTITLDQALAVLAQPRMRRGQVAKPPLKDLGKDPDSDRPLLVKDGRFGPYVTDGETNASLRKGDSVEELTLERALELLADRRAAGPSKKKAAARKAPAKKKAAAKKAPAKKAAAKKAVAKKAPAKKAPAKKAVANQPDADGDAPPPVEPTDDSF